MALGNHPLCKRIKSLKKMYYSETIKVMIAINSHFLTISCFALRPAQLIARLLSSLAPCRRWCGVGLHHLSWFCAVRSRLWHETSIQDLNGKDNSSKTLENEFQFIMFTLKQNKITFANLSSEGLSIDVEVKSPFLLLP